jgi:hypothetical protein
MRRWIVIEHAEDSGKDGEGAERIDASLDDRSVRNVLEDDRQCSA